MSQVLYRKYRPKNFGEITGQDQIIKVLLATIKAQKPAHAYLFSGPRGTGKTSTARIFAREINGITDQENNDAYIDIIEIDAASNRGINEIRELKEKVAFAPAQLAYKVYIIDEVHMLTKEAFNAILKTLEEPPGHTIFIMATTEIHKVPATILSRVVRLDFKLASSEQLLGKLSFICEQENVVVEEEALKRLVRIANGSFRDAESLLEKVINVGRGKKKNSRITLSELYEILGISPEEKIAQICQCILSGAEGIAVLDEELTTLFNSGINPQQFLFDLSRLLLDEIMKLSSNNAPDNKNQLRNVYKLTSECQQLISNYNHFLDPLLAIKLALINVSLGIEANNQPHVVAAVTQANSQVGTKITSKLPAKTTPIVAPKVASQVPRISPEVSTPTPQTSNKQVFTEVNELFREVIQKVRESDSRLATMLGQGRLVSEEGGYRLLLPYKFHLDQMQKTKNRMLVMNTLFSLLAVEANLVIEQDKAIGNTTQAAAPKPIPDESNKDLVEEVFGDIMS